MMPRQDLALTLERCVRILDHVLKRTEDIVAAGGHVDIPAADAIRLTAQISALRANGVLPELEPDEDELDLSRLTTEDLRRFRELLALARPSKDEPTTLPS